MKNTKNEKPLLGIFISGLICTLIFAACYPTKSSAPLENKEQIKEEITIAFNSLASASKSLDTSQYYSFFDKEEFTLLNADGTTIDSFEEFKAVYDPQFNAIQKYNKLDFDPVIIHVIDDENSVLVNEYSAELVLKSGDLISASGAGAQFWSKRSGEWKLVHVSNASKP